MKLQTEFAKSLPLTTEEKAINAERAAKGFEPYIKLRCYVSGEVSRLATREELAVEQWTVYGKTAESVRCPKHIVR